MKSHSIGDQSRSTILVWPTTPHSVAPTPATRVMVGSNPISEAGIDHNVTGQQTEAAEGIAAPVVVPVLQVAQHRFYGDQKQYKGNAYRVKNQCACGIDVGLH